MGRASFRRSRGGYSLLELLLGLSVLCTISAISIPAVSTEVRNYRIHRAVNLLQSELNLAKMRAVAMADPFQVQEVGSDVEVDEKNLSTDAFSIATNTKDIPLPNGVSYGFGTLSVEAGDSGEQEQTNGSTAPAQSTTIIFNSLGLPVTSAGVAQAQNAFYVTDGINYGAVTVSLSGRILAWYWQSKKSEWVQG